MKATVMAMALAAVAVLPSVPGSAADGMPKFDVRPSCRGASAQTGAGMDACLADEERARQQLAAEWAQFPAGDRAECVRESGNIPGLASYVELLTCLQIAREARSLPKEK
jgi:hypothetical protein